VAVSVFLFGLYRTTSPGQRFTGRQVDGIWGSTIPICLGFLCSTSSYPVKTRK